MSKIEEQPKPAGSLLLAFQVKHKHCLVIGSGNVALSRIEHLIRAEALITVIAGPPGGNVCPEIRAYAESGKVYKFIERDYEPSDLTMYENVNKFTDVDQILDPELYALIKLQVYNEVFAIVCCCIDNYKLLEKIYYQCKYLRLPVNIADKPPLCDFYFGLMYNQDNLQIMVSTNGKLPRLLRMVKDNIAKEFDGIDLNKAVENLGLIRLRLRNLIPIDDDDVLNIDTRMNWIKCLTDFFTLKEWLELELVPPSSAPPYDNRHKYIDNIIKYFPDYPPSDFEEFKQVVITD